MLWYYARNGQRFGPVEEAEIQRLAQTGQLSAADLVWKPGLPEWRPAGQTQELAPLFRPAFPAAPAPPPPPPPAAPAPMMASAPAMAPPSPAAPAEFSPYAPPSASLTSPPAYGGAMFGTFNAVEYASFGSRLAAMLIDQVLLTLFTFTLVFIVGLTLTAGGGEAPSEIAGLLYMILNLVNIVAVWLYYAGLESSSQMATIGKRILGLKVTDLEGQRIGLGRATGRYFGKILSAIPLFIGFFMMLSDEKKQTWHDKLSGCLVVRAR